MASGNIVNIGLKNDQIMQRYLVRRIFREVEFKVVETDGTEHIGFITGFDDKCLQLSTTPPNDFEDPRSMIIYWPIRRIEETGRLVDALPHDQKSKIRSYSHALRAQCEAHLNGSKGTNGQAQKGPKLPPDKSGMGFDTRFRTSPHFSDQVQ